MSEVPELAKHESILDSLVAALHRLGVVGEDRACKLVYLALTSRLLLRILSLILKAHSSSGKSYVVNSVLRFFPKEAYIARLSVSEKALVYSGEDFRHKIIVIQEAAGLGPQAAYIARSLLSEGYITHEVSVQPRDAGEWTTKVVRKEGPTGMILTTTEIRIHPENETRMLSVPLNESPDQTRRIMLATARGQTSSDTNLDEWLELQRWLTANPASVQTPFAEALASIMPTSAIRLRRDFGLLLTLIQSHALLHQATRLRDSEGSIVASLDDYEAVRCLTADLFAEGVEASVPPTVRETVRAVAELGGEVEGLATLAQALGRDRSTVSRRICSCLELGFLVEQQSEGLAKIIRLGSPLPDDLPVLPTRAELEAAWNPCSVAPEIESVKEPARPLAEDTE